MTAMTIFNNLAIKNGFNTTISVCYRQNYNVILESNETIPINDFAYITTCYINKLVETKMHISRLLNVEVVFYFETNIISK